jgi:hypothetical protein
MSLSIYDVSVPVFMRRLSSLSAILKKAADHAAARKIESAALLTARLYPDMFHLTRQVQTTADFPKLSLARVAGIEAPKQEDTETSFEQLIDRIEGTLTWLNGIDRRKLEEGGEREVTFPVGRERTMTLPAPDYLMHFVMPNFYFHVTTAYAILRHNGVEIGKRDFLGAA